MTETTIIKACKFNSRLRKLLKLFLHCWSNIIILVKEENGWCIIIAKLVLHEGRQYQNIKNS